MPDLLSDLTIARGAAYGREGGIETMDWEAAFRELKACREALRFYADPKTYDGVCARHQTAHTWLDEDQCGNRARACLPEHPGV